MSSGIVVHILGLVDSQASLWNADHLCVKGGKKLNERLLYEVAGTSHPVTTKGQTAESCYKTCLNAVRMLYENW